MAGISLWDMIQAMYQQRNPALQPQNALAMPPQNVPQVAPPVQQAYPPQSFEQQYTQQNIDPIIMRQLMLQRMAGYEGQ